MGQCPDAIKRLIDRFNQQSDQIRSLDYNETLIRIDFINPLMRELGWDIDNTQGFAEQYREVVHEDRVKVAGLTKAPDYSFRVGGQRKFFLEAKKPAVDIKGNWEPAYQLRRYAWSAKLCVSLLTDFEELAVYDARIAPRQFDKPAVARRDYIRYTDYPDRWEFLAGTFSKEAVLKGEFDRYCASKKGRGAQEFDDAFLSEIEEWRKSLASSLARNNADLDEGSLNFAVQKIIDRILFLRIAEDRGTEPVGQLMGLLNGEAVYPRLLTVFNRADERYNSGLFHFHRERGRDEPPDTLTPALDVDDRTLKPIIKALYYPQSPYEFTMVSADILGSVYERFLGKVITLTPAHRAKIEEKPEVRKAGGVYYTPTYIVDYIVRNTVGRLLEEASERHGGTKARRHEGTASERHGGTKARSHEVPEAEHQVAEAEPSSPLRASVPLGLRAFRPGLRAFRVLDPACGSGSFLIGAYQFLLDWHLGQYLAADPARLASGKNPRLRPTPTGGWALTIAERKRILLDHIHGVDLDAQAVEVTKLNLLLKCLEGETSQTLGFEQRLFRERALPDLGSNIKCGNSLIGTDIIGTEAWNAMTQEERRRINPFDYERAFPHVFKGRGGGFDAVIGNPPYGMREIHLDAVKGYFKQRYAAAQGSYEHYFLFYEASLKLLAKGGCHGFIVPVTWLTIPTAKALRRFVLESYAVERIVWLPELVFRNAQVNTLVSVIWRRLASTVHVEIHDSLGFKKPPSKERQYAQADFLADGYALNIFADPEEEKLLERIAGEALPLKHFARPCSGYNPYEVGAGIAPDGKPHTKTTVQEKPYHSERQLSEEWKPEIVGRDLGRYSLRQTGQRWIKYGPWLAAARDPNNFVGRRLLVQEVVGGPSRRLTATYCDFPLYHSRDVIPIKTDADFPSPQYLLAILNSRLLTWYHHKRNPKAKKGLFPKVLVSDLAKLPVINPDTPAKRQIHDHLTSLVDTMLTLHKRLAGERVPQRRVQIEREIDATDRRIDALVYDLYALTPEEIALVESATR